MQQIVRLIGHQKLGAIRCAQNQRPRRAEARNHHRILSWDFALVQQAADLAFQTTRRNGRLYRDGQSEQRSARALATPRVVLPRAIADTLRIEVGEYVQLRIQSLDLLDVRLGEFDYRDFARAQKLQLPRSRLKH